MTDQSQYNDGLAKASTDNVQPIRRVPRLGIAAVLHQAAKKAAAADAAAINITQNIDSKDQSIPNRSVRLGLRTARMTENYRFRRMSTVRNMTPRRKTEFPLRGSQNVNADSYKSPNRQLLKARQSGALSYTHSFRFQSTPLRNSKSQIQYDEDENEDDQGDHATLSMTFQKFRVSANPLFSRRKSTCIKNTSSMPDKGRHN